MPGPNYIMDKGFYPQAAVSQFYCVKGGTVAESVTPVTATNDPVLGVAQEPATTAEVANGKVINIRLMGISRCVAKVAISRWAKVRADASGKVTTLAGTAGLVENVVGIAMTASTADGDHIDILLTPGAITNTAVS